MKLKILVGTGLILAVSLAVFFLRGNGKTETVDDFSYTLGHQYGQNLKRQGIERIDSSSFTAGAEDALAGKTSRLTAEKMQEAVRGWQQEHDKKIERQAQANEEAGRKFMETYRQQSGVQVTPSGLLYKNLNKGAGPRPKATDIVKVHYRGKLIDGTEFDSSHSRGRPDDLPLKSVIAGWAEMLQLMNSGSKVEVVIPSRLAYGNQPHPQIPPGSTLIYEVELLEIK